MVKASPILQMIGAIPPRLEGNPGRPDRIAPFDAFVGRARRDRRELVPISQDGRVDPSTANRRKQAARKQAVTVLERIGLRDAARMARAAARLAGSGRLRHELEAARSRPAGVPVPGPYLLYLTQGTLSATDHLASGRQTAAYLAERLAGAGLPPSPQTRILDFGCGVGRVLRSWPTGTPVYGCEYNPRLAAWCAAHLGVPVLRNGLEPPTPYPDGSFDALYAISVMTHLPPDLQVAWMKEWARLVRPGGVILATFHGPGSGLGPEEAETLEKTGSLVRSSERAGSNLCAVWNSPADVAGRVAEDLTLLSRHEQGTPWSGQDLYVLRVGP